MAIKGEVRDGLVYVGGRAVAHAPGGRTKLEEALCTRDHSKANKGRGLEEDLEATHQQYAQEGLALLHKVPTEWVVLRDHDNPDPKKRAGIKRAFPKRKAIVDFLGLTRRADPDDHGWITIPLAIEAKEYKDRFQLSLDPETGWLHEVEFMRQALALGAAGFFVIRQTTTGVARLVPGHNVVAWADTALREGRKSRTIQEAMLQTYPVIGSSPTYPVDWLPVLQDLIKRGEL